MKSYPVVPLLQRSPPPAARTQRQFVQLGAAQSAHVATWKRISAQMLPPVASTRHFPWPPAGPQVCVRSTHQFFSSHGFGAGSGGGSGSGGGGGAGVGAVCSFLAFFLCLRLRRLAEASSARGSAPPATIAAAPTRRPRRAVRRGIEIPTVRVMVSNTVESIGVAPSLLDACPVRPGPGTISAEEAAGDSQAGCRAPVNCGTGSAPRVRANWLLSSPAE